MIEYFSQRPYLILIMAAVIALTVFVCVKAGKASAARSRENEAIMKKLKEENELRNEFAVLTQRTVSEAQPERLFRGVALNLQKRISDSSDMLGEFEKLTQEQREIYALSFVEEDGSEKLSDFFRANGAPLTLAALDGIKRIFGGRAAEIFEAELNAFDPENEEVSFIPEQIQAFDSEFAQLTAGGATARAAGKFITENAEKFTIS
ncbi:MAG: hypothetical protein Q4B62_01665 [Clostridiaceae bacterium]|nr:hypothetical protein [Clostridiaceae bacterium]